MDMSPGDPDCPYVKYTVRVHTCVMCDLRQFLTCFSLSSSSLSNSWQDSSSSVGGAPVLLSLPLRWDRNALSAPVPVPAPAAEPAVTLEMKEGGVSDAEGVTEEESPCPCADRACFTVPSYTP
jgi:hypothetical protein